MDNRVEEYRKERDAIISEIGEFDEDDFVCGNCEWYRKEGCLETGDNVYADDPACKEYRD